MHITDTLPHASLRRATPIPEICQKCDRFAAFAGASAKYLGERKGELTKKRWNTRGESSGTFFGYLFKRTLGGVVYFWVNKRSLFALFLTFEEHCLLDMK